LKRLGYDVDQIAKRVAEIYDMDPAEVLSKREAIARENGYLLIE
jgi:hypothetical protein